MPRRRWLQVGGELVELLPKDDATPLTPMIVGDLPGYESPVTGRWVEGRRARREDLKQSGCRPWEGLEQEQKEAAKQRADSAQRYEKALERDVRAAWQRLSPAQRRILGGVH